MNTRALSDSAKKRTGGRVAGVLFGLIFAGAGVAMLVFLFVIPVMKVVEGRSWSEVPCTVVSSSVTTHSDSDGTTYGVEIRYRYEVDGRSYTSDRRSFAVDGSSSGRSGKEKFVANHPPGKAMTCYVDPADPASAVLDRGVSASFLWGLFPLPFLAIGLFVIYFSLRGDRDTAGGAKSKAAKRQKRGVVPAALPEAAEGPLVLRPGKQRLGHAFGILLFVLFWNGIVGVFLFQLYKGYRKGEPDICQSLFMLPFIAVGVGMTIFWVQKVMLLFAPVIELELDRSAIPLGGSATLKWRVISRLGRLTAMSVVLEGEERATYRRGTDTITDTHTFYEQDLAEADGSDLAFDTLAAVPERGTVVMKVPGDTMHTFKAGNNKVVWTLKVHGQVPRWPDPVDRYELTVLPMRLGGAE